MAHRPGAGRAGSFDQHFAHMQHFWNQQLAGIAQISVPDASLVDAYRSGFIYTEIARSGDHLNTGVNGYESEYSHDVIGILTNLFTQGDFADAHALLLEARTGGRRRRASTRTGCGPTRCPWAIYLMKTGDLNFVKANFATDGPAGAARAQHRGHGPRHRRRPDRAGGIMEATDDIDSNGYWTTDDYEALMGLAAYRYLATGSATRRSRGRPQQYDSLLAATNRTSTPPSTGTAWTTCPARWCNPTPPTAAPTPRTPTGRRRSAGGPGTAPSSAPRSADRASP